MCCVRRILLSSSDFRQITIKGETLKAERLFRAAVSAFCSLTRPSRREIAQLEDLTLPLFDFVSVESRRYVAAALSECQYAPAMLVRRLADETVDIAAPLLIRSNALSDIDLIALIGRHGIGACPRHRPPAGIERDHCKSGGCSGREGCRDAAGQSSAGSRFASGGHAAHGKGSFQIRLKPRPMASPPRTRGAGCSR